VAFVVLKPGFVLHLIKELFIFIKLSQISQTQISGATKIQLLSIFVKKNLRIFPGNYLLSSLFNHPLCCFKAALPRKTSNNILKELYRQKWVQNYIIII